MEVYVSSLLAFAHVAMVRPINRYQREIRNYSLTIEKFKGSGYMQIIIDKFQ